MKKLLLMMSLMFLFSACNYKTSLCEQIISGDGYVGSYSIIDLDSEDEEVQTMAIVKSEGAYFLKENTNDPEGELLPIKFCKIKNEKYIEASYVDDAYQLAKLNSVGNNEFKLELVSFSTDVLTAKGIKFDNLLSSSILSIYNEPKDRDNMLEAMTLEGEDTIYRKIK